jgi:hypothetical protein
VKEQVVLQLATEENERAVKLADEGRTEEARSLLKATSDTLDRAAKELESPVLQQYAGQNAEAADSLDDEDWKKRRKIMLEEQSLNKTQRSY